MNSIEIAGSVRTGQGKKAAKEVRSNQMIPCNLYGGSENVKFSAPELSFRDLVYTPNVYIVKLKIDDNEYDAVMREIQFHPVTDKILHIDFMQIFPEKAVTIDIPVRIKGTSEGQRMGGRQLLKSRRLAVKALPADLPDNVEIDVSPLLIGQEVRIKDLTIKGVEFLEPENNIIVAIRTTRVVVEEEETTEGEGEEEGAEGAEGAEGKSEEGAKAEGEAAAES